MSGAQFKAEYYSGKDTAQPVYLVDANGNLYTAGGGSATSTAINDGSNSSLKATVGPFHNSDNQAASGIANALFSAGIAQILNPAGTIDRQRGTGTDSIPAVGIATGTQQLAGPALTTTLNGAITGSTSAQTITVASTSNLKVGDMVVTSDNAEVAEVVTVPTGTTFTATLKNNHANGATLTWYHYNQARDASIGDQVALTGMSPSQTYLYNTVTGLAEIERSAAGELDGGKGIGFNAAVEQEFNGGGPVLASGLLSGMNYDRARNVQAKSLQTATLTATVAGDTVLKFASAAATNTVQPGAPVLLAVGSVNVAANQKEIVYVSASWTPGSSANVPLQSPVVNAGSTTAAWEIYATQGPALTGFTGVGLGIEEEALYDPVTGLYYIERSATQDGVAAQNVVMESVALWNGSTMDRWYGDATGKARVSLYGTNTVAGDTSIKTDNLGNLNVTIQQSGNGVSNSRPLAVSLGGASASSIAAATSANTVIKASSGRLGRVLITANGSNSMTFYDNGTGATSGTIIGILPATTTVGQVYDFQFPAANGITVGGNSGNPGVTVGFF